MLSLFSCLTMRMGQLCHATLSSSDEPTLLRELWDYFIEKYFTVRFEQYNYQNISVRANGLLSAQAIIIAFFIGLIIAAGLAMFQKRTLGDLVRALDRENANEPARAMTLEQLGLIRNTAIKQDLRHGTALRRVVRCVEEEEYLASMADKKAAFEADEQNKGKKWKDIPFRYDFYNHHFYIPAELMFGADVHFDKKGSNPLVFAFTVVLFIVVASLVCYLLPEMLQLADNFIGMVKG
ncbi:MAG: hypothetical protein IKW66_01605 [Clostridia bacterium]|nr:hypothetical protein [Clostridia bacterium]MBR5798105.1 hypothetical protein [Clostridia bacterium]